ncbi:MAG: C-terminal helicase domain-containing protein, partial [Bacteroidota bacterium]|nr:C-terminal helicase domain-containing protein [Bacteroidota bacterium]
MERATPSFSDSERRQLAQLAALAKAILHTPEADTKLECALNQARRLISEGYAPIFWCRYVATAEYLAEALQRHLPDVHVACVTGRQPEDERRARIERIPPHQARVLVATDCLSEGINLHEKFDAVVHYDLPWNPNRLEQREVRVDRFGQSKHTVRAVLLYGRDNPVDGTVLDVLLRKAREIHRALGVFVPLPTSSESVVEALTQALLLRGGSPQQLSL